MIRSNSKRDKWKDVLGFDDGGDAHRKIASAYPTPPSSPPPGSSLYSGFRDKIRARSRERYFLRSIKSQDSLRPDTPASRETFWSRSHTRNNTTSTNQSGYTIDSAQSRETFWSRSHKRSNTVKSQETFCRGNSREVQRPWTSNSQSGLSYPRFPKDITFFRSKSDILLSPSSPAPSTNDVKPLPAPPHLFYITIQKDAPESPISTARPDIILHSGPSKESTVLCLSKFHSVTQATDITLCPPPPKSASANFSQTNFSLPIQNQNGSFISEKERPRFRFEVLSPSGGIFTTEKYSFYHTLPKTSIREKFEWKYTSGPFVRTLENARDSGGLKLIRTSTGDVVAVYAGLGPSSRASNPNRVMGMFRFLRGECAVGLDGEFEALAVMSILSIVERNRRTVKSHKATFRLR